MKNDFLYNDGAERQDELDLNVDFTLFRMYDPAMGRWWQVDPKASLDTLRSWTPYNYSFNNPVRWNDPLGDCPPCEREGGKGYLGAALQRNVTSNVSAAKSSASNIVSGSFGGQLAGIGGKLKIAGVVHGEMTAKVGAAEVGISGDGMNASVSAVTTDFGVHVGEFGGSYSQKDMTFDGEKGELRERSGSANAGPLQYGSDSNEISIGATLGNVSAEISANLNAVQEAVANTVEAVKEYVKNLLPETVTNRGGSDE